MRCGPRSVCRTRTAGAGLPGCACLLGTAGLRLPGYLCRAAPAACPTTWDRIFIWMAHVPVGWAGRLGRSPGASGVHRRRQRPATGRPPTCGLGRRSSSQRARPTGHTYAGNSTELPALSPPGPPGTAATHHGCHCRSPFSGHCTGVSMSTHRAIRGPCTARRWQLRPPRPAGRLPTCGLGRSSSSQRVPGRRALLTQAILPNCLLSPAPARRAPRLPTTDATAAVHSPVIVPACRGPLTAIRGPCTDRRWQLRPPGQPGAFLPAAWAEGPADSVPGRRGTPYCRQFYRNCLPLPAGTPGTAATHHGYRFRSTFSGHCTGLSMSLIAPSVARARIADGS